MNLNELKQNISKLFQDEMSAIEKASIEAPRNHSARTILFEHSDSIVKVGQLLLEILKEENKNESK